MARHLNKCGRLGQEQLLALSYIIPPLPEQVHSVSKALMILDDLEDVKSIYVKLLSNDALTTHA